MHKHEMRLTMADVKAGWCNGCTEKPPYSPDMTYALRAKTTVMSFCPKCAREVVSMFTNLIGLEARVTIAALTPLVVLYSPIYMRDDVGQSGDVLRINSLMGLDLDVISSQIEEGQINRVILCGPAVVTGWRIYVRRAVRFEAQNLGIEHAAAQLQARYRIFAHPTKIKELKRILRNQNGAQ